jgi:RNA polymerase sigma-B factor
VSVSNALARGRDSGGYRSIRAASVQFCTGSELMKNAMRTYDVRGHDTPKRARPASARRTKATTRQHDRSSDELVAEHLRLAEHVARRYTHTSEPLDDLVQVARIGLIKAARRWDPDRGSAFTTFAVPTILGELRRHFRDRTWTIRPPRDLQELYLAVNRAREGLWQELGREPTAQDVAERLDRTVEEVVDAFVAADAYAPTSLDARLRTDDLDGATGHDLLVDDGRDLEDRENRVAVEQLAAGLSDRDREVVRLRFAEDMLQREIAARVGCSQMHVSRILRDAVRQMRQRADAS